MEAKKRIKEYLDHRADTEPQFAEAYRKEEKTIDGCWQYILSEARKKGQAVCMTDEEVFGLAVHYYDESDIENDIEIGIDAVQVSVSDDDNHIELTAEDRERARQMALQRLAEEQYKELKNKPAKRSKKKAEDTQQMMLFDDAATE